MTAEEVVVPFGSTRSQLASEMRSTLLTTSIQSLRAHGHFDRYVALVPRAEKETILTAVAGVWLPIGVGQAHYGTCERLGLATQEQFGIGKEVGDRVQGTLLGLLVRTAKSAGLTPWAGLSNCTRLYERLFKGGAVQLVKLGPKEARMEIVNNGLFGLGYFRNGFRGIVCAGVELACEKGYVHELPRMTTDTSFGLRISWA